MVYAMSGDLMCKEDTHLLTFRKIQLPNTRDIFNSGLYNRLAINKGVWEQNAPRASSVEIFLNLQLARIIKNNISKYIRSMGK